MMKTALDWAKDYSGSATEGSLLVMLFEQCQADARRAALSLAADHVLTQLTMAQSGMPADLILLAIDKTLRSDDFRALLVDAGTISQVCTACGGTGWSRYGGPHSFGSRQPCQACTAKPVTT